MAITAFLSRSPELFNREPGGSASLGYGPHSSIFSPTALLNRGSWGTPLLRAGPLYLILSTTDSSFLWPGLYNNLTSTLLPASVTISHSIQPLDSQGYILIFLDRMHLLFTLVHFLFWQLALVGGQYTTISKISASLFDFQCVREDIAINQEISYANDIYIYLHIPTSSRLAM